MNLLERLDLEDLKDLKEALDEAIDQVKWIVEVEKPDGAFFFESLERLKIWTGLREKINTAFPDIDFSARDRSEAEERTW